MKRGTRTKTRRNWSRPFPKMCNEPLVSESCEGGSVRMGLESGGDLLAFGFVFVQKRCMMILSQRLHGTIVCLPTFGLLILVVN